MIKKIFLLWDNHTIGFCRVLFALMFLTPFSSVVYSLYGSSLLLLWLILKTGYEKKWKIKNDELGGEP